MFFWAILASVFFGLLSTIRPLLIQYAFDNYILNSNTEKLLNIIIIIFIFLLFEALFQFVFIYQSNYLAQKIIKNLRANLFDKIISFQVRYFDSNQIGKTITRLVSDIEAISSIFSQGLLVIFGDLFKVCLIITCMFFVNWRLALISLAFLPFLILATILFQKHMKQAFVDVRKYISQINTFVYEHIIGMNLVQIFSKENNEFELFKNLNSFHRDAHIKTVLYFSIFLPIVDVFSAIAMGLIVWYGSIQAINTQFVTIGQIVAFILFINMLFRPLRGIADRFNILQMGVVAANRVFVILESQIKQENVYDSSVQVNMWTNTSIVFKDVTFSYKPGEPVLNNIQFTIHPNDNIAIIGSTGSGKTTIINLLMKWYDLSCGDIYINENNLSNISIQELRKNIGIVLQNNFFLSDSLMNNIKFFNDISDEEVYNAVEQIGLEDFINKFPEKYNYHIGERGNGLSQGEKQLISFLRTYLLNPACFILDEATSSMDPFTEKMIQKAIKNITKNRTSIIIAHRLSTIQDANKILVLENGDIVESGTHKELINLNGKYANYYYQQFI